MKTIINFENFSFKYESVAQPTLKNINLKIYEGEKVLIAGPSGSGKSTLGNTLNGLIPFSYHGTMEGSLVIDGIKPFEKNIFEISNHVGTVLQDQDGQFIGLSVGEDVAFIDENNKTTVDKMVENVKKALSLVGLTKHINKSPFEMSGGQKQSVSLAGILNSDANILLFDEPLANLDPASGKNAMKLIKEIQEKNNKTIVVIEHRIEDVLEADFDRIILIDKGEILANDTPENILKNDLLRKNGLREPLYLELLRETSAKLDSYKLTDVNSFNDSHIKENIHEYITNNTFKETCFSETILEVKDLNFTYEGGANTTKNLNFDLKKGEVISLLGNNGAGKSTLSKLITGILKSNSGDIFFKGDNIKDWSIKQRGDKIGYVMQNPNHMLTQDTLFDEVALGLKVRNFTESEINEKVQEALTICGLIKYKKWPSSKLSYGQKKRLSIAAILALNPEVLILDEPTAGQDFKHYKEFMKFIKNIANSGVGIILITHDMELALEYTSRSIVLNEGNLIANDSTFKILSNKEIMEKANLREVSINKLARTLKIPESNLLSTFVFSQIKGGN